MAGHRIIAYVLPALNGVRRAFASAPFVFTAADPPPTSTALAHPSPAALRSVFSTFSTTDLDSPSSASPLDSARAALATLEQYQAAPAGGPGLAPTTPLLVALEAHQAYWSSLLAPSPAHSTPYERWTALLRAAPGKGKEPEQLGMPSQIAAEGVQQRALAAWREVLRAVENDDDEGDDGVDLHASEVLIASLVRRFPPPHPSPRSPRADRPPALARSASQQRRPSRRASSTPSSSRSSRRCCTPSRAASTRRSRRPPLRPRRSSSSGASPLPLPLFRSSGITKLVKLTRTRPTQLSCTPAPPDDPPALVPPLALAPPLGRPLGLLARAHDLHARLRRPPRARPGRARVSRPDAAQPPRRARARRRRARARVRPQ